MLSCERAQLFCLNSQTDGYRSTVWPTLLSRRAVHGWQHITTWCHNPKYHDEILHRHENHKGLNIRNSLFHPHIWTWLAGVSTCQEFPQKAWQCPLRIKMSISCRFSVSISHPIFGASDEQIHTDSASSFTSRQKWSTYTLLDRYILGRTKQAEHRGWKLTGVSNSWGLKVSVL